MLAEQQLKKVALMEGAEQWQVVTMFWQMGEKAARCVGDGGRASKGGWEGGGERMEGSWRRMAVVSEGGKERGTGWRGGGWLAGVREGLGNDRKRG